MAAAFLLALAVPALAGVPATRPASETVVLLRPTAIVTGEEVLLSDLAELTGETSELAGEWSVAAAPHPGTSGVIDAAHIQSVLSHKNVNLSNWIFRGASRCVVSRPVGVAPARKTSPVERTAKASRKTGTAGLPTTRPALAESSPAEPASPDPTTLEGVIHAHVRERLGNLEGALAVKFSPTAARLLALSTAQYQFQVEDRGQKALGMVPLEVTVLEKGRVQQVVQVLCEATLRKQVVVAGRGVNRGEILQAGDLRTEVRTYDRVEDIGLSDAAPLTGQRVKRLIKSGEQLVTSDVETVPLVERNDLVTVSVRRGKLTITSAARALESGSYGDTITLRSELSKDKFTGVVTGSKTVELSDAQPAAAAVAAAGGKK